MYHKNNKAKCNFLRFINAKIAQNSITQKFAHKTKIKKIIKFLSKKRQNKAKNAKFQKNLI